MWKFEAIACSLILVALTASCALMENGARTDSAEDVFELLRNEGMTCRATAALLSLPGTEKETLGLMVQANLSYDSIGRMIDTRARDCEGYRAPDGSRSETQSSVTSTYRVEPIEEASGSGGSPATAIYSDSASLDWMCNSGKPATWLDPADYIANYHVNGAYANWSRLKVRGSNLSSNCYIHGAPFARVYSDDDIRMCIGYFSITLCPNAVALPGETFVWLE